MLIWNAGASRWRLACMPSLLLQTSLLDGEMDRRDCWLSLSLEIVSAIMSRQSASGKEKVAAAGN